MSSTDGSMPPSLPANEEARLRSLLDYRMLDTPAEPIFDHLTSLAATLFQVPCAYISFCDEKKQFIKSAYGLSLKDIPREHSFCAHVILETTPLVILDAQQDVRFQKNPYVTNEPNVRFAAGAPLIGKDGLPLGGFCLLDTKPHAAFSQEQQLQLQKFAQLTVELMAYRAQHAIAENESSTEMAERWQLATQAMSEGIWDWDCATDSIFLSARLREMLGREPHDIYSPTEDWLKQIHPADRHTPMATVTALKTTPLSSFQEEYRVQHADGSWRWLMSRGIAVRDAEQNLQRVVGTITDVTGPRYIDPLTGLHTRTFLLEALERRLHHNKKDTEKMSAVIFLDLDVFKRINSSLGRSSGDTLLVEVAHRISATVADDPHNLAARISGDEFAILLDCVRDKTHLMDYVQLLQEEMQRPYHLRGQHITMTASIGIAMGSVDSLTASDFLHRAEVAKNECKLSGGSKTLLFSVEYEQQMKRHVFLASDLREALEKRHLQIYYQPKVDIFTQDVIGFEALARWNHPKYGNISPEEFIHLAEEDDLIFDLGNWILDEAMRQFSQWRMDGVVSPMTTIAINLSAMQLRDQHLVQTVKDLMEKYNLPPECMALEVTEGVLITETYTAQRVLTDLKRTGLRLDLDDFGTGYSSLSYLRKFPFDSLKVDRSFVQNMENNPDQQALLRSIIALAQTLNLSVIAEGVEKEVHLQMLQQMGCDYGQGYYFSKPIPPDDIQGYMDQTLSQAS